MVLFAIGLALIDCLNPTTIATMTLLLPLVKRVEHTWAFITSTFMTYYLGGMMIYFGMDQYLSAFFESVVDQYANFLFTAEVVLGGFLAGYSIFRIFFQKKKPLDEKGEQIANNLIPVQSIHPLGIFIFGIGSTLSDLPTAAPFLIFIGKISEIRPPFLSLAGIFFMYVFIYSLPLILIYGVYLWSKENTKRVAEWFIRMITLFNRYALHPLLSGVGIWLILDGISNLS